MHGHMVGHQPDVLAIRAASGSSDDTIASRDSTEMVTGGAVVTEDIRDTPVSTTILLMGHRPGA